MQHIFNCFLAVASLKILSAKNENLLHLHVGTTKTLNSAKKTRKFPHWLSLNSVQNIPTYFVIKSSPKRATQLLNGLKKAVP